MSPIVGANNLTLVQAEILALRDEPGLLSQKLQARSMMEKSVADAQLMDPKIRIGLNNLPTDTFDFGQEPMTQLKVSYLQQFPSGNTLELKQQKSIKMSELIDSKISGRKLTILKEVRLAYLEIFYLETAKATILKNKKLFSQLVDIVQSLFSVGKNNQQDLIRAQLGLSRLDDRLAKIDQKITIQRSKLSRWIGHEFSRLKLSAKTPQLPATFIQNDVDELKVHFLRHPKVLQIDMQIQLARKDIQLIEESLNSGWGLNVSYGYRGDDPSGKDRADFLSVAATFDLPFFAEKRQDKKRLAKEYDYQSLKNKRLEIIRLLVSQLQQQLFNKEILIKRQNLYNNILLPQAKQQSQSSIIAYQSDRGNFADVLRAYMDDLNAKLDAERIATDIRQAQSKILYFVPTTH